MEGYAAFIDVVRKALFWLGLAAAIVALVDWLVRTRRINPFGPVARFFRKVVDPLMRPIENRIVRAGGLPNNAPWWTLVVVVVGGLVLIWLLQFIGTLAAQASYAANSPGQAWRVAVMWVFALLRVALIVRVVSTWFGLSPYAWYIRWTHPLTEWMLGPLRRLLPTFGPLDISPILAFFLLGILESVILR